jgi:hypothetical protein
MRNVVENRKEIAVIDFCGNFCSAENDENLRHSFYGYYYY